MKNLLTVLFVFIVSTQTIALTFFSQGSNSFSSLSNWNTLANGLGAAPVAADLTSGVHNFVLQAGHTVTVDMNPSMVTLTINGSLVMGNNTSSRAMQTTGLTTIAAGGSLVSGTANATHTITFSAGISNSGSVNLFNSSNSSTNVVFNAASQSVSGTGTYNFGNFSLATSTSTSLTLNRSVTINGSVNIPNACTLNDGGLTHFVSGDWIESGTGALTGAGTIEFFSNTLQTITAAATFNNMRLNMSGGSMLLSGAITVNGNLTLQNASTLIAPGNVTHTCNGNLTVDASSSLNQTAGTFSFAATANTQTINSQNCNFFNLTFSNGGSGFPKTIAGDISIPGLLTINAGAALNSSSVITLNGGLRCDGICNFSGTLVFSGINQNITTNQTTMSLGTASIVVNMNAGQNVAFGFVAPATSAAWLVSNNVTINSGDVYLANQNTLTGQPGFNFNLLNNSTFYCRGNNNFPSGFSAYALDLGTTVFYDQNIAQVVRGGLPYGNLSLSSNTKTCSGDITVLGNLSLSTSVTANFLGFSLSVQGNLTNSSGCTLVNDQTLFLNAPNANQTISGTGTYILQNLNCSSEATSTPRTKTFGNDMTVKGDFVASNNGGSTNNTLTLDFAGFIMLNNITAGFTLGNNVVYITTGFTSFRTTVQSFASRTLAPQSTIRYANTAAGVQLISNDMTYGNLDLSGASNKAACGTLTILGDFTRSSGNIVFRDSSFSLSIAGNYSLRNTDYPNPSLGSTFTFNGDAQILGNGINDLNLPNVVFSGTGLKQFSGASNNTFLVSGNLQINNGVTLDANVVNLNLRGNFTNSGTGVFTQTSNTTFSSTSLQQNITANSSTSFGNVIINKPSGTLANRIVKCNTETTVSGTVTFTSNAATLDISGVTINVGGNWTFNTGCSLITPGGSINFNGNGASQVITNQITLSFNNLLFTGQAAKSLAGLGITINGNVTITGALFQANNIAITANGNWTNNGSFAHTNTVTLSGSAQVLSGNNSAFFNLIAGGTDVKTIANYTSVSGALTINAGVTLDLQAPGNSINIGGNYTNNGVINVYNNTVSFTGGAKTIVTGGTGTGKSFYNLLFNATSGTNQTISLNNIEVLNDLTINGGTFAPGNFAVTVGGNLLVYDVYLSGTIGTLTLNASGGNLSFNPGGSGSGYRTITVNAPGAVYTLTGNDVTISGTSTALSINAGQLNLGGRSLTMSAGSIAIATGGTFTVNAGAQVFLANGQNITNNGGTLAIVGSPSSNAFIRRNGTTGGFSIVQSSGNLQARYYVIENSGTTGFTIGGSTVIHPTNNLSNGTFIAGTGAQYINLTGYNFTNFTVNAVQFYSGPTYNVSRTSGTGTITFNGATGSLAGSSFENDPLSTVNWTAAAKRWTGTAGDNNWSTATNWSPAIVPLDGDTVYLDHTFIALTTAYTVNVSTADAAATRVIIDRQGGSGAITLNIASGRTLAVSENINVLTGCSLVQSNTSTIKVGGSFIVTGTGTFVNGSATLEFIGNAGYSTISPGSSSFFNLTISGSSTYVLASAITIQNNLQITNGQLDVTSANHALTVQGNWTVVSPGSFNPRTGTVTFSRSGAQTITGGTFNTFVTGGSGEKSIASNLNMASVTIAAGTTLNGGGNTLVVTNNWINNAGINAFSQTASGLVQFSGTTTNTSNQQIDNGTSGTTYSNLFFTGSAIKTLYRDITVNGDFTIGSSCGNVDLLTSQVTGTPSKTFSVLATNTIFIRGASNFPTNFGTVSIASANTCQYITATATAQNIFTTTYGNLDVRVSSGSAAKNVLGSISIQGNFIIDAGSQVNASNQTITLTGNLQFASGGNAIQWGTSGTLIHNGSTWIIDANYFFNNPSIPEFRNLTLSGSSTKTLSAGLNISGNLQVQNNITLVMGAFTIRGGGAGSTLSLQNGATLTCAIPTTTGVAFPTNFGTYSINQNSTVNLNGGAAAQTISNVPTYGNLTLSNTSSSTIQAGADLNIAGNFITNSTLLFDNGRNINCAGATIDIRNYTPTAGTTITLNGSTQNIVDNVASATLDLSNIVFANAGNKTISSVVVNTINISGTFTIASGVTVTCTNRQINFSGTTFTNNGTFYHQNTAGTSAGLNFTGGANQVINLGALNTIEHDVTFNKTAGSSVTFVSNNGNFVRNAATPTFVINAGVTVNMGSLTHTINGSITNNGTFNCAATNFIFSGSSQNIAVAGGLTANNITITGTGTKTLGSNWSINDLTINTGSILNTSTSNYSITCTGNWTNNGTFTVNSSVVYFESNNTSAKTITAGISSFRDVVFNGTQTNTRNYTLQSASTTFSRQLTINNGATLSMNGNDLTLGSSNSLSEIHTVNAGGRLLVSSNSQLSFNNADGNSTLNVSGILEVIGNNVYPARIGRSGTTNRHQINLLSGSTIKAQYYNFEYLTDAGMNIATGATVDPTFNLSNGTWSYINTATGTAKYYLVLNGTVITPIQNVIFNFVGTPTVNTHFNVARTNTTPIQFNESISGNLGGFSFESDGGGAPSATTGYIRWPITQTLTWTGNLSIDWNVAGNWSPAQVPTAFDNAIIPSVTTNNPRVTSANAVCKNLTITNGNMGIQNGYKITVSNDVVIGTSTNVATLAMLSASSSIDVGGAWTNGTNGVFVAGTGTVNFTGVSGYFEITPGNSPFYNVNLSGSNSIFSITGSSVTFNGSLTISNSTLFPNTSSYNYYIKGNFTNNGVFTNTVSGTTNINGSSPQTLTNVNVFNLVLSGGNTKTTAGNLVVAGSTTLNSGTTLLAFGGSIWDLRGNVTFNAGSTYNDGGNLHQFSGGTWSSNAVCTNNTGGIRFVSANSQYLDGGAFNQLTFETGGAKILSGDVTVNGDVFVSSGTGYLNMDTYQLSSNNPNAVFSVTAGSDIYIRGANNCPSGFGAYNFDPTSNTYFDGTINQIIAGIAYGNVYLSNTVTKTLSGNTTIQGNLSFNNSTLDCSVNNYTLFIGGNYTNNTSGSFIANQGEVIFNGLGSSIQIVYNGGTGIKTFYNVTINRPQGQVVQFNNANPVVLNNLSVLGGNLDIGSNTVTVGKNLDANGGLILTSGSFILNGTGGTGIIRTSGSVLNNLTINAPGSTYTVLDNLGVNGSFTLTDGTFNGNGFTVNIGTSNNAASIQGNYIVGEGGKLGLGNGVTCTIAAGATFTLVGSPANISVVSNNNSGGRYNFIVNGTISAQYYLFEYMSASAIQISSTATIDASNNLSNGTFTNGIINGTYLRINNGQTLTIENVTFPVNPGGSARNISKTVASGTLTFNNYSGVFSGPLFEDDPFGRINWTGSFFLTWNGSVSNNWFTPANWTASAGPPIVPTGAEDVIIPSTSNQPLISFDGAITNRLTINSGATLTMNTPYASSADFTVLGDLQLNGNLVSSGAGDTINIKGNWTKATSGNLIAGNSWVIFNAGSGTRNINNGSSAFNHFVVDGPITYQLGSNTIITGNVEIKQGTLDVTSTNYNMTVGGNWSNASAFTQRSGTVTFNSSQASAAINPGVSRFFNLVFNGAANTTFSIVNSDLRTSGNTTINSGTLFLNNRTFFNGDNTGSDGISVFGVLDMGNNSSILNGSNAAISVNNGGRFRAVGSSSNVINTVSRQSAGSYSFTVNSGATLQLQYYVFSFLNASGLQIKPGANIHPVNNLSDGGFTNGTAGGTYLDIQCDFSDFTVDSVSFSTGPSYNVTRLTGTGVITFLDASGALSGSLFENDDLNPLTGLVRWNFTNPTLTWTGNSSTEWGTPGNWNTSLGSPSSIPPNNTISVIIPNVASLSGNFPVISNSTGPATCSSLDVYAGAILTLQDNQSLTASGSITNLGNVSVAAGSASVITVSNLWSNSGTFTAGNSTVVLNATGGFRSITPGASVFYNLSINGSATFQTVSSINVSNDLLLSSGTFTITNASHQLNIGGNFTNNATFNHGNGVVLFNKAAGTQTISGNIPPTFFNFRISNTGTNKTVLLACNITILANLDILSVRSFLDAAGNTIDIKGNWSNAGGAFSSTGTVTFSGTSAQSINRTNAAGENFFTMAITNPAGIQLLSNVSAGGNLLMNAPINLNGKSLFLTGTNRQIQVSGGVCNITSSLASSVYIQNGAKTVVATSGGTLSFGSNATLILQNTIDFGNNLTTINGTLQFLSGGAVTGNPPIYATGSTLAYSSGGAIGRGTEWSSTSGAGYPFNVTVNAINTVFDLSTGGSALRQIAGNLSITNNSQLRMNAMSHALNVRGNISVASGCALVLGTLAGGDLQTGGNISVAAGSITLNSREVICNGSTGQTINGISTYSTLTINNSASPVTLLSNIAISGRLRLVSGSLNTNGFTVTMQNFSEISRESVNATMNTAPVLVSPSQYSVSYSTSITPGVEWINQTSAIRDVSVSGAGSILTLNNARTINRSLNLLSGAGINLNGQTLTLLNNGTGTFSGSIFVSGNSTISNAAGTGTGGLLVTSNQSGANPNNFSKQVLNNSGTGTLTIAASVTMTLSDGLFDFGAASGTPITTINGVLQIGTGARVTNNACVYGTGSVLRFSNANSFTVNAADLTWAAGSINSGAAGIPWNVEINDAGTQVTLVQPRAVRNNLLINFGSLTLNYLSNSAFVVGGNWTRNGLTSAFNNPFDRKVSFEKSTVGNQVISTGSGITAEAFYDLVVNHTGGGMVQANCDLTIADTLAFTSGKLQLAAGSLMTIGSPFTNGNIAGCNASRYIVTWSGTETANIQHYSNTNTTYNFAIGDNNNYTPIVLTLTNGAVPGSYITGTMRPQVHPNLGSSANYLKRYWSMEQSGLADGFLYTVDFVYADEDVTGSESLLMPFKYHAGTGIGSGWVGAGGSSANYIVGIGSLNAATNTLHWENVNSFSDITGNGGGTPLPITLLSFDAKANNNTVQLTWSTLSEVNNDYFTIERSNDGVSIQEVARVKGAGNHNGLLSYAAEDENPLTGTSYYRLKQTDFNGNTEYTSWKAVLLTNDPVSSQLTLYPNPVSGGTCYLSNLSPEKETNIWYTISDASGKVYEQEVVTYTRDTTIPIKTAALPAGVYLVQVSDGKQHLSRRLLVK